MPITTTYNVMDYGAVGNGTTDDSAAFQSALNAAATAGFGTEVVVPIGLFLIAHPITVPWGVSLKGLADGRSFYPYNQDGATNPLTTAWGPTLLIEDNVGIAHGGGTAGGTSANTTILTNGASAVTDLIFGYPQQTVPAVTTSAFTPIAYPWTIALGNGTTSTGRGTTNSSAYHPGVSLANCLFLNSYQAIRLVGGAHVVENTSGGAFSRGLMVDNSPDLNVLRKVGFGPAWDAYIPGVAFAETNADRFCLGSLIAFSFFRCDGLFAEDLTSEYSYVSYDMNYASGQGAANMGRVNRIYSENAGYAAVRQSGPQAPDSWVLDDCLFVPMNYWYSLEDLGQGHAAGMTASGVVTSSASAAIPNMPVGAGGQCDFSRMRNYALGGNGSGPGAHVTQAVTLATTTVGMTGNYANPAPNWLTLYCTANGTMNVYYDVNRTRPIVQLVTSATLRIPPGGWFGFDASGGGTATQVTISPVAD